MPGDQDGDENRPAASQSPLLSVAESISERTYTSTARLAKNSPKVEIRRKMEKDGIRQHHGVA